MPPDATPHSFDDIIILSWLHSIMPRAERRWPASLVTPGERCRGASRAYFRCAIRQQAIELRVAVADYPYDAFYFSRYIAGYS